MHCISSAAAAQPEQLEQEMTAAHLRLVVQLWQRQVGAAGCERRSVGFVHEQRGGGGAIERHSSHAGTSGAPKL